MTHRSLVKKNMTDKDKHAIGSALSEIQGIGEKTAEKLIKHFKSVKKLKEAQLEEIEKVIGKSKAKVVHQSLN